MAFNRKWPFWRRKKERPTTYQIGFRWAMEMYRVGTSVEKMESYIFEDDMNGFDYGVLTAIRVIEGGRENG